VAVELFEMADRPSVEIEATIKSLSKVLREKRKQERLNNLRQDKRLADSVDEFERLFYQGEYAAARALAATLWRSLNLESPVTAESNWKKHLADYKSIGTEIRMPPEWGFRRGGEGEVNRELELERGLSYVIGARPGTGKTTLGVNLAYYYAMRKAELGLKVLFLTNEMKPGQIWAKFRQIDMVAESAMRRPFMLVKNHVRYPEKFEAEFRNLSAMCEKMSQNMAMASVRRMPIEDINMVVHESARSLGKLPDIVILDYIQRVPRSQGFATEARLGTVHTAQAISEIALDIDGVFFTLSQMNKDGGFKESEAPEEEAGIAWEVSRPENQDGSKQPFIDWKIKKSRISAYFSTRTSFDDVSGSVIDWR